jgi:hypothetical protein
MKERFFLLSLRKPFPEFRFQKKEQKEKKKKKRILRLSFFEFTCGSTPKPPKIFALFCWELIKTPNKKRNGRNSKREV